LPDCDVALIATPVHSREQYLMELARRKVPVFVEKPFAITAVQHRRFMKVFGDTPIACGYMRRTYASIRSLRQIIAENWFGPVLRICYAEGARASKTGFGESTLDLSYKQGGGVLRDLGCHGIDAIGFITNADRFVINRAEIAWDSETDRHVDCQFDAICSSDDATKRYPVDFTVSWLADQPNQLVVEFERTIVTCGTKPDAELAVKSTVNMESVSFDLHTKGARSSYQSFFLEWEAFLDSVREGHAGEMAAAKCIWTTEVIEAIYQTGGGA